MYDNPLDYELDQELQDAGEDMMRQADGLKPKSRLRDSGRGPRRSDNWRARFKAACPKNEDYYSGSHAAHCKTCGRCKVGPVAPCWKCA